MAVAARKTTFRGFKTKKIVILSFNWKEMEIQRRVCEIKRTSSDLSKES